MLQIVAGRLELLGIVGVESRLGLLDRVLHLGRDRRVDVAAELLEVLLGAVDEAVQRVAGVDQLVPVTGTSIAAPPLTLTKNDRVPLTSYVIVSCFEPPVLMLTPLTIS